MLYDIEAIDIMLDELYRRAEEAWTRREREDIEKELSVLHSKRAQLVKRDRR